MLRTLYGWVLRAHPPYFRQRFAEEMQSIFDHAQTPGARVGLLVDAGISLARQWGLRPQFWEQPNMAAATDGPPLFHTLGNTMPRKAALVLGGDTLSLCAEWCFLDDGVCMESPDIY